MTELLFQTVKCDFCPREYGHQVTPERPVERLMPDWTALPYGKLACNWHEITVDGVVIQERKRERTR